MALVVSRKENESIMIGDDIEVCVEAIEGGRVRLSINAPKDVKVLRYELWSPGRAGPSRSEARAREVLRRYGVKA